MGSATIYCSLLGLFLLSLCDSIQVNHRGYSCPNHKVAQSFPISSNPSSSWSLLNTTLPSGWSLWNSNVSLPLSCNGTTGLSIEFVAPETGIYTCEIEIKSNVITTGMIEMSIDATTGIKQAVGSSYFSFVRNLTAGNFIYYLWAQNAFMITYISISPTIRYYPVFVSLQHHPSQHLLLLITNISSSLVSNTTKFIENTRVTLSLKSYIPPSCSLSQGATTNPADFAGYNAQTDFYHQSQQYLPRWIQEGNSLRQGIQAGIAVVAINNILVDCTVDVNVQLGDGVVLADKYWAVFNQSLNTTIQLIETSISLTAMGKYYAYIIPQQQVTVTLQNLVFNPDWDLEEIKTRAIMQVTNTNCQIFFMMSEDNFLKVFCHNTTAANNASTYVTSIPALYLRDKATLSLLNITVVTMANSPSAYVVDRYMTYDVYYYMGNSIMQVLYSVQIEASWQHNLSSTNIYISINGFSVPTSWIRLIANPNNLVAAQIYWVGLANSDQVSAQFLSNWQLDTAEGYHNQWFGTMANISFLPGNSTSSPSLNVTNITVTPNSTIVPSATTNMSQIPSASSPPLNTTRAKGSNMTISLIWELVRFVKYYTKSYCVVAFAYFISSLINMEGLTLMYYFLSFQNVHGYNRNKISESVKIMNDQTGYYYFSTEWLGLSYKTSIIPDESDPLLLVPTKQNAISFSDFGYHSDFLNAEFEILVQILITILKLLILGLLIKIPSAALQKLCTQVLSQWDEILIFEFIMLAPQINVVTGIFYQSAHFFVLASLKQKLNLGVIHFGSFLCLFLVITVFIKRYMRRRNFVASKMKQRSLHNIKDCKQRRWRILRKKVKNWIIPKELFQISDEMMFILVPFLAAYGSSFLFITAMTLMTALGLHRTVQYRHVFKPVQFWKKLLNKLVWFCFNLVYLCYWLTEVLYIDCSKGFWLQVMIAADFTESLLFILGCFLEIGASFLELILQMTKSCRSLMSNRISGTGANEMEAMQGEQNHEGKRKKAKVIFTFDGSKCGHADQGHISKIKNMRVKERIKVVKFTYQKSSANHGRNRGNGEIEQMG